MKVKVSYIYIGVVVIAAAIIILSSISTDTTQIENGMPHDEIHQGLTPDMGNSDGPSRSNVSEEFLHQMEMYKKAVAENPGDTLMLRKYAELLSASHSIDKGNFYFKKILEVDSKRTDIMTNLVYNYYNKGKLDSAEIFNKKILTISPEDLNALYNKGVLEATKGDTDKARQTWEALIKFAPESEQGKLAKENLDRLSNSQ